MSSQKVLIDFDPDRKINTVITRDTMQKFLNNLFDQPVNKMIHLSVQKLTEDELSEVIENSKIIPAH